MKLPELKAIAKAHGIDSPEGDQRKRTTWINALLQGGKKQPSKSVTTPKKAKKEGKKQMETPSKVLINNEIHVGETYEFIKGKYKGKTGVVQSVGPKTCKLKVGRELTGNIRFDSLVWTGAAQMKTPSKVDLNQLTQTNKETNVSRSLRRTKVQKSSSIPWQITGKTIKSGLVRYEIDSQSVSVLGGNISRELQEFQTASSQFYHHMQEELQ